MMKKKLNVLILLPLILILAACSSLKLPGASQSSGASSNNSTTSQQGQNQSGQEFNMANQPIEQKLALGTLKLEGTGKAITAEQAKALLPLWKAVKTMSSSSNTSQDEMNALYKQIEEAMTADQVQAIKDLNISQDDLQALMKQYGIQAPQMGQRNASGTPVARSQSGTSGTGGAQAGGQGGFPGGDAGGPPPDGGFPGGGQSSNTAGNSQGSAQGTPRARPAGGGFRGGVNFIFVDPLIKMLEQRVAG